MNSNTKQQLVDACIDLWFETNESITADQLKVFLNQTHSTLHWGGTFITDCLYSKNMLFTEDGKVKTYYLDDCPLRVDNFIRELGDAKLVTKTGLKTHFRKEGYSLSNFNAVFELLNFQATGNYTSDNHKIYKFVPTGKHLSTTKDQMIEIKDMAKPYLKNAFIKTWYSSKDSMEDVLNKPESEHYRLLQAFFTFDIRQVINKI